MSYIPYDSVVRGIEDIVQSNGKFDGSKTGTKVAGIA